jgi:ubiquitin carboxyl-terminal hydrolase 25/28
MTKELEVMEKQVANLNAEIEKTYIHMNDQKYYLLSILIHDGLAQSGHYYSFIHDFVAN